MTKLVWGFLSFLVLSLLRLRYQIEVQGIQSFERLNRDKGILFLPNHPAQIDPLILLLLFWPRFRMRPLVVEYIYRQSWLRPIMKLLKALPIPNFETSVNQFKIKKAEEAIGKMLEGLKERENFLLYPAGKLKSSPRENLGGALAAHAIYSQDPSINVVLIRTTGLWGKQFFKSADGTLSRSKKDPFSWGKNSPKQSHLLHAKAKDTNRD